MTDRIITVLSVSNLSSAPAGPYSCCPTCGDPEHGPGDCTDQCWNPHLYDGEVTG